MELEAAAGTMLKEKIFKNFDAAVCHKVPGKAGDALLLFGRNRSFKVY